MSTTTSTTATTGATGASTTLYLVTGAAGFLGSNVCAQLLERGDAVRALVLPGDPAARYLPDEVEQVVGDLTDPADVERLFRVPEGTRTVCIHCASLVTVDPDYSEQLMCVNVDGTQNVIDACRAHPECARLVYVSSTGAIPELPHGLRIKEVRHFYPYDESRVVGWYSRTKAMATQRVLDAAREGLDAVVVHPSGILGPGDHAISETTRTLIDIINGKMPVGMAGSFNLCDVRDLAAGTIAAADRGRAGECYILANEEVSLKELCDILRRDLGCKGCSVYLPLSVAKPIARQMEAAARRTGDEPLMTSFSVYNLERNNRFDYTKAIRELGYAPRSYEETLHDIAAWLREEGLVDVDSAAAGGGGTAAAGGRYATAAAGPGAAAGAASEPDVVEVEAIILEG